MKPDRGQRTRTLASRTACRLPVVRTGAARSANQYFTGLAPTAMNANEPAKLCLSASMQNTAGPAARDHRTMTAVNARERRPSSDRLSPVDARGEAKCARTGRLPTRSFSSPTLISTASMSS